MTDFVTVLPLSRTLGWRGRQYLPGATLVPADLAAAAQLSSGKPVEAKPPAEAAAGNREQELQVLYAAEGWDAIKAIAEEHGISKPSEGWKAAIPLIVETEK